MYSMHLKLYLIAALIPVVNPVSIDNSNLTHLDCLYFKHNKRHKLLAQTPGPIAFVHRFRTKNGPETLHIASYERIKVRRALCGPDLPETRPITPLHMASGDEKAKNKGAPRAKKSSGKKGKSKINGVKPESSAEQQDPLKGIPKGPKTQPSEFTFREEGGMKVKLSEYESLMAQVESLSKSKEKSDKDLYSFIQKNLKESSVDPEIKLTVHDILKAIDRQAVSADLQHREWCKYMNKLRAKALSKLERSDKIPKIENPVEVNLRKKAKEDACGFRYPILGSPDEIYTDPYDYKFWGRTPLSQTQSTHPTRESSGKLVDEDLALEDMALSSSARHQKRASEALKSLRETNLVSRMETLLKSGRFSSFPEDRERAVDQGVDPESTPENDFRYRNVQLENDYEAFKKRFLSESGGERDAVLGLLSRYNPWDEYIKMRKLKSALPPIGLNYKVNLRDLSVSFRSRDSVSEEEVNSFLKDYLHHFLVLEKDEALFNEFKNAKFLYDVLKYFDLHEPIEVEKDKEYKDLEDRLFQLYFPTQCPDGFPKRPKDPEFPLTMGGQRGLMEPSEGAPGSYHRVNMECCLMALVRCHLLVRTYSSDIFSDQRIRAILDTIERGLLLETQRMDYGITDIEINNLSYKSLCKIDGEYLALLTDILVQWNLTRGVENILDLVLLLTLKGMESMDGKSLLTIVRNISHLTTLPESVYINFLARVVEFVHERLKFALVNGEEYIPLEDALDLLTVLSNYPAIVTRPFMETFVQAYRDRILTLAADFRACEVLSNAYPDDHSPETTASPDTERLRSHMFALVTCLQLSGLIEYMYLLDDLSESLSRGDFKLNSVAAISVLETFTDNDDFQRRVLTRTKNILTRLKNSMDSGSIVRVLEAYTRGVRQRRLQPDPNFFCTVIKQFCFLRSPEPDELVTAARLTDECARDLTRRQLKEIFTDLTNRPLYFNFLTRIGLRGEFLEYPISAVAQVLYYAAKNDFVDPENWETFHELLHVFKHILTLDVSFSLSFSQDVHKVLDAVVMANFTGADELLDLLCKRVCNLIEISEVKPSEVLEVMDKCLKLDYVPMQLLRFYTYSNMFELDNSDLIRTMVDGEPEYDVDFRGWKRPVSFDEHTEWVPLHRNQYSEVKMRGTRPLLSEGLKYSLQPPLPEPLGDFEPVARPKVDSVVLRSLADIVRRVQDLDYKFSERDRKLINTLMERVRE